MFLLIATAALCITGGLLCCSTVAPPRPNPTFSSVLQGSGMPPTLLSNGTASGEINTTSPSATYFFSIAQDVKYNFEMKPQVGCAFDLILKNASTNATILSSTTRSTSGKNDSIYYFVQVAVNCNLVVLQHSGNGSFTLTAIADSTPCRLISPSVSPGSGNLFTTFNFTVWYKDSNNPNPPASEHLLLGISSFTSYPLTLKGSNFTAGVQYSTTKTSLALGNYSYYFQASDDGVHFTNTSVRYFLVTIPPTLNANDTETGMLNASAPTTGFTFQMYKDVKYNFEMKPQVGCAFDLYVKYASNNSIISSSTTRSVSGKNDSVYYHDITQAISCYVVVQWYSGNGSFTLTAIADTSLCGLYSPSVSPSTGTIFTKFEFSVWYHDANNPNQPKSAVLKLGISSPSSYSLTLNASAGSNYTTGVQYYFSFTSLGAGTYNYQFSASDDGSNFASTTLQFLVVSSPPILQPNETVPGTMNATITSVGYSFQIYKDVKYWFEMKPQAGCDFDLYSGIRLKQFRD